MANSYFVARYHKTLFYNYQPKNHVVSQLDTSRLRPAKAVPILMYHGIVQKYDTENTEINHFISQMEALKRAGYSTITLQQFENFLNGEYVLPPKPIVITFDDGRRDSYYTSDNILKKLNFHAVMFVATAKQLASDPFFLSWDELRSMQSSGRWEIQAHGRDAHQIINTSSPGGPGTFLTSLLIKSDGTPESITEYHTRIEQEYKNGISDLQQHLNITPVYYAIPLNEYETQTGSGSLDAMTFNQQMVSKYFRLSFIQSVIGPEVAPNHINVYNYRDVDRHLVARIEPKNMDAATLLNLLNHESPTYPELQTATTQPGLELKTSLATPSAQILFGDNYWDNYTISVKITHVSGRSEMLLALHSDNSNYVSFGVTDKSVFLRETKNGVENSLMPSEYLPALTSVKTKTLKMIIQNNRITCFIDNRLIFENAITTLYRGKTGIKIWDNRGAGDSLFSDISVHSSPGNALIVK